MNNPDERLLKAFIKLSGDIDFTYMISWIVESLEVQMNDLIDNNSDRNVGAVTEVREIYNTIKDAKKILDKLEAIQSRKPHR